MADIKETLEKASKKFKPVKYRAWDSPQIKEDEAQKPLKTADTSTTERADIISDEVIYVDPNSIVNWEFHDRPESELGDIAGLANEFKTVGQQQPCIVRALNKSSDQYELIIGERRWRAALLSGVKLHLIVKDLTDNQAALAQAAENENRKDLSEYAKGISYSKLIDAGVIKQSDLVEKLGRTKQYISALMSYSKIPLIVLNAIGNCSSLSASSAEKIKRLCDKGEQYVEALISIADRLRTSKMGPKGIEAAVEAIINKKEPEKNLIKKIITNDGRHVFTWRDDNNKLPSIHFPKQIGHFLLSGKIGLDELSDDILELLEKKLERLK